MREGVNYSKNDEISRVYSICVDRLCENDIPLSRLVYSVELNSNYDHMGNFLNDDIVPKKVLYPFSSIHVWAEFVFWVKFKNRDDYKIHIGNKANVSMALAAFYCSSCLIHYLADPSKRGGMARHKRREYGHVCSENLAFFPKFGKSPVLYLALKITKLDLLLLNKFKEF